MVLVRRRAPPRKPDCRSGSEQIRLCLARCGPPPWEASAPWGPGRAEDGLRDRRGGPWDTPRAGFQLLTIVSGAKPPVDDRW